MGLYSLFQTDSKSESDGIVVDYGSTRITLARAGGKNDKYKKILERKIRPYRKAIQTGTMDDAVATTISHEAAAEGLVLNWEEKQGEEWVQGIESRDGSLLPFTAENVANTFRDLPDFFRELHDLAADFTNFRSSLLEEDSKNS